MPSLIYRLAATPAVRDGRVFVADGNAYFNRPGPRLVESAEIALSAIHPELAADRSWSRDDLCPWPLTRDR